ncbi:hypothetical protein CC86DRAFT_386919 [Ophiobolus disseminans]|uniref:Uncharacterized protein n=1 Tax=Ophiobolus disseminans TaxID=1469910 RepID=A0A6A6ZIN9_9PLEO|nr:hypothetical protein CC86DRAFT_386919 [Ophiobolus disseminans]
MQILTSEPTVTTRTMSEAPNRICQAVPCITDDEFVHLDGREYVDLTKDMFSGPAQMASMATRAVGMAGNFTHYGHLKNGKLECDNAGEPVECPKCPKGDVLDPFITTYDDTITGNPPCKSILLNIGSKNAGVAFRL